MFKVGDKVIKARPYSIRSYCKYGGEKKHVPIGTKGVIESVGRDFVDVVYSTGIEWKTDESELDLEKIDNWKEKMEE
jgi:hypothetical protein